MKKLMLLSVLVACVFMGGTVSTANAQWRGGYRGGYYGYRGGEGFRGYRPYYGGYYRPYYGRAYYGYPAYGGYGYGYGYPGIGITTPGFSVGLGGYYW